LRAKLGRQAVYETGRSVSITQPEAGRGIDCPRRGAAGRVRSRLFSVKRALIDIETRREAGRQHRHLAVLRSVAIRAGHARLATAARAGMVIPGQIWMSLANPTRILAGLARH
jgi:hypothetical protein